VVGLGSRGVQVEVKDHGVQVGGMVGLDHCGVQVMGRMGVMDRMDTMGMRGTMGSTSNCREESSS